MRIDSSASAERGGARRDHVLLALAIAWVTTVYAAWGYLASQGPRVVTSSAFSTLSDQLSWQVLAAEVARGNLFPIAPSLGTGASGVAFLPYLSLWVHGALVALFGAVWANAIGIVVFPTIAFGLMARILRTHLPRRWSLTLTALGMVSFSALPLRRFLLAWVGGASWRSLGTGEPLDVAHFPMPALSLCAFLAVFLLSIERRKFTVGRLSLITALWALQSEVHMVNAVVGLTFWFAVFPVRMRRQQRNADWPSLVRLVVAQTALALVVLAPAIVTYVVSMRGGASIGSAAEGDVRLFGPYYYVSYFVAPLAALAVIYRLNRVDPYELVMRFWPVFFLMGVELTLTTLHRAFGVGVPAPLLYLRLGMFFLHLFYLVPPVYYLTHVVDVLASDRQDRSLPQRARRAMQWVAMDASRVYLPVFFVLTTFAAVANFRQARRVSREQMVPEATRVAAALDELRDGAALGDVLVAENAATSLSVPLGGRYGTLLVNRFANRIAAHDLVERLALHARLVGWREDEFVAFMSPRREFSIANAAVIDLRGAVAVPGLGYWLLNLREVAPDSVAASRDLADARSVFAALDVGATVRRLGVRRVLSHRPLPDGVMVRSSRETPFGTLYELSR